MLKTLVATDAVAPKVTAVVVMGVAGSGKSTVGAALAAALGARFVDGDDLHPASNVAKMAAGIPLDDDDRLPWLEAIRQEITAANPLVVIACSALKRKYRDILRGTSYAPNVRVGWLKGTHEPTKPDVRTGVWFLGLMGTEDLLLRRIGSRQGHFMKSTMLRSQLDTLEPLQADELGMSVDIDLPVTAIVDTAVRALETLQS